MNIKDYAFVLDTLKHQNSGYNFFLLTKNNGIIKVFQKNISKFQTLPSLSSLISCLILYKKPTFFLMEIEIIEKKKQSYYELFCNQYFNEIILNLKSLEIENSQLFNLYRYQLEFMSKANLKFEFEAIILAFKIYLGFIFGFYLPPSLFIKKIIEEEWYKKKLILDLNFFLKILDDKDQLLILEIHFNDFIPQNLKSLKIWKEI